MQVERRGAKPDILISEEDLARLELLEDRYWADEGRKALREFRKSGKKAVPLEQLKAELGL